MMNDDDYLKFKAFHIQKLLEPDKKHATECAFKFSPEIADLRLAYRDGFLEAQRQLKDAFSYCAPQDEINLHIDELIDKLERLKK